MTRRSAKPNPENERLKRRYAEYLKEAKRLSEATVDKRLAAIALFETETGRRDFKAFNIDQAIRFKTGLRDRITPQTGKPLASSTADHILQALRGFVFWLADQPGFRSRIRHADADYFNLSNREQRLARSGDERPSPSLEQVLHVLRRMPGDTVIQQRDRAIIAFLLLTGIRDGAAIGLRLKHVDLQDRSIRQDAREVRTKFSRTMTTWFLPVGNKVERIFQSYVRFLREDALFGPDDPLFPATRVERGTEGSFVATGLSRTLWASAQAMRSIVQKAFLQHDLPAYGPHSFRKTLARLGQQVCATPEEMKAWSQNLGHEEVLTTLMSYGKVSGDRQREVMARMRDR